MNILHWSEYPIPQIVLVGFGREQMRQFKCHKCKATFFEQGESIGIWNMLCSDCVEKPGSVFVESDTEQYMKIVGWEQRFSTFKRRTNYNYIKVAKRDNYTCQYCGYSPRLFVDFKPMHVDHIKPFSAGGGNSMNNLTMACSDCNLHLSNKIFNHFHDKKIYIFEWRKKNNMPYTHDQWLKFDANAPRTGEKK